MLFIFLFFYCFGIIFVKDYIVDYLGGKSTKLFRDGEMFQQIVSILNNKELVQSPKVSLICQLLSAPCFPFFMSN